MTLEQLYDQLIGQAQSIYREAQYEFLNDKVFSHALTPSEQHAYIQLLDFARSLQLQNPTYESDYHSLIYLYVLNGGRLTALQVIDRRLKGLKTSDSSLVFISGVSGIGKTSLALAFQDRSKQMGVTFVLSRCREQETSPYALWKKVAHHLQAITSLSSDDLASPIGRGKQAGSSQQLIFEFSEWLLQCVEEHPIAILLDDLQWADTDSLELLDSFTSIHTNVPILFIATYRTEEAHNNDALYHYLPKFRRNRAFDLINLNPLNREDITRLSSAYHGMCSPMLVDYLIERAEGHPFFTIELLDDLIKQNLLLKDANGFWLPPEKLAPVPRMLRQLITQRVNRLGASVEQLLKLASVVGEIWHMQIVEALLELPESELIDALEIALQSEIIAIEDDTTESYRFTHGLIRHVLYQQQIVRRRKRLHEQIAMEYEKRFPENPHIIAYHADEGEVWHMATDYYAKAAQEASGRLANNLALHLYQQALNAAQQDKVVNDVVGIYERMGRIYQTLEQRQNAEMIYSRMHDTAQSIGDHVAEGRALAHLGYVRISSYQFDLAADASHVTLQIAEKTNDSHLYARAYMNFIKLIAIKGELEAFDANWAIFLKHAEQLKNPVILSDGYRYLALKSVWTCQYPLTEVYARKALEYAQETSDPPPILGGHQILSFSQIELGQYSEAYQQIESIVSNVETLDTHYHQLPRLLNQMGYLMLELGAAEEALLWDKRALEASQNSQGANVYEMQRYSILNIATDLLYLGHANEALDYVTQFEAIKDGASYVRFRYYNRYLLLMSEIHFAQDLFKQAIELAQEARAFAIKYNSAKNIAKSHWMEGVSLLKMHQNSQAIQHLNQAIGIADEIQHGSLTWKIRLSLIEALLLEGMDANTVIYEARQLLDHTIDSLSQPYLRDLFLNSAWVRKIEKLEQTQTPAKLEYPAGLTQREVEVLRLVASGYTNQKVAEVLHISPRTVNTHMTNILNKTNCDNRTAASAFAIRNNLLPT